MEIKPNEVLSLEGLFQSKNLWFITTNNHNNEVARGCWDAVNKRRRLEEKIPIFCELKSDLGYIINNNTKKYLMLHFRGNQERDDEKIKKIAGREFQRIEDYLFTWDDISEGVDPRLIEYLILVYRIEWIREARFEKSSNNKVIKAYFRKNILTLHLIEDNNKVKLIIDDNCIGEFIVEKENNKLKIYKDDFGLINPFLGFDRPEIMQIFDESLIKQTFIPNTMMTNACHRKWGIEFKLEELIINLPNVKICDITKETTKFEIKTHKIGILTGNSPESGMLLWENINFRIRENFGKQYFLGDLSFPEVIIESIPAMGLSMELEERYTDVEEVVIRGITNLCDRGATIVCIACNTTQYFTEIAKNICLMSKQKAIFISIPDVTYKYLKYKNISKFDFLAAKYASDFNKWSGFKDINKEFTVILPNEETINKINKTAYRVKKEHISPAGINELRDIINTSTQTNTIILALTELSILFNTQKRQQSEKIYYDTLTILAEAIGDLYTREYLSVMKRAKNMLN